MMQTHSKENSGIVPQPKSGRTPVHSRKTRARSSVHQGQALILAVLLMLFAALLGATFITVVSLNLNQTARVQDKSVAAAAAKAGMEFANQQLTYSSDGPQWFARNYPTATLTTLITDPSYYSTVDKAQGWAGNFAKFPDPRQPNEDSPNFLVRVEAADPSRPRLQKITVIGLSPKDPAAFEQVVAYKDQPMNAMREVGMMDWAHGAIYSGTIVSAATVSGVTQLTVTSKATFPSGPFTINIGGPKPDGTSTALRSAVVQSSPSANVLTLATLETVVAGERIEMAADLGGPQTIDYENSGTAATQVPFLLKGSETASTLNPILSCGIRSNAGIHFTGNFSAPNLQVTSFPNSKVEASGTIVSDAISATYSIKGTGVDVPIPQSSSWTASSYVSDGWDILAGNSSPSASRANKTWTPPNFSSGTGLERYRTLTKFADSHLGAGILAGGSTTSLTGVSSAPLFGYGYGGIYINNPTDVERTSVGGTLHDMTQAELTDMWLSPVSSTNAYDRISARASVTSQTASLEDQHLRGWVTPTEFVARGALVEINDAGITITRDARSDNDSSSAINSVGPVLSKAWTTETGGPISGLYTQTFAWPATKDGLVIFAEGNIRVRGVANAATCSVTVVSMNNVYIEGSTSIGTTHKLLLLGKKNVVMNPTRILGSVDGFTQATGVTTAGATTTVSVSDSSRFKPGDEVQIVQRTFPLLPATPSETLISSATVTGVGAGSIDLPSSVVVTAGNDIRHMPESVQGSGTAIRSEISAPTDAIQRRNYSSQITPTARVRFDHGGSLIKVLKVTTKPGGYPDPGDAILAFKRVGDAGGSYTYTPANRKATSVSPTDKIFYVNSSVPTQDEILPSPLTGSESITNIVAIMNGKSHIDATPTQSWIYDASLPAVVPPATQYGSVPYFYLAGVGERYEFGAAPASDWRKPIGGPANSFEFPLATSIEVDIDGNRKNLQNIHWTGSAYDVVRCFGFDPLNGPEDVLTGDQSFYNASPTNSSIDSRAVSGLAVNSSLVMRQSTGLTGITVNNPLPTYRLRRFKLEDLTQTASSSDISAIAPGTTIDVNAYVYAQEGSWFVIPGDFFRQDVHVVGDKSYIDLNANNSADPSEFVDVAPAGWGTGDFADLNRNGIMDEDETPDALKYTMARYNYQINFTGAIMENRTPVVNDAGTGTNKVTGAVADWTNKWAAVSGPLAGPTSLGSVKYYFDPALASGAVESEAGFVLPQTEDLVYQG